ncbi:hypothetical protein RRG08_060882 [Elysia crispata]|nr:hypothetical protein RRG08_060882 [Elysia crispata]
MTISALGLAEAYFTISFRQPGIAQDRKRIRGCSWLGLNNAKAPQLSREIDNAFGENPAKSLTKKQNKKTAIQHNPSLANRLLQLRRGPALLHRLPGDTLACHA